MLLQRKVESRAIRGIRSNQVWWVFRIGSGIHLSGPPAISLQFRTFKSCSGSWTFPQKHLINCTTSNKLRRIRESCYKRKIHRFGAGAGGEVRMGMSKEWWKIYSFRNLYQIFSNGYRRVRQILGERMLSRAVKFVFSQWFRPWIIESSAEIMAHISAKKNVWLETLTRQTS